MLTIVCGEDNVASRNYYNSLKQDYLKKNYEIKNISISDLPEIDKWIGESVSLFSDKQVFFIENLNKKISKTNNYLIDDRLIDIIDWEDSVPSRNLKISKDAIIKEFKPSKNIFQLLDSCYPTNLLNFLKLSILLTDNVDGHFIFTMLTRHIKSLIYASINNFPKKIAPWQMAKLKKQASFWDLNKLLLFYDGLYRIEVSAKTGTNPYPVKDSIDILVTYFL